MIPIRYLEDESEGIPFICKLYCVMIDITPSPSLQLMDVTDSPFCQLADITDSPTLQLIDVTNIPSCEIVEMERG